MGIFTWIIDLTTNFLYNSLLLSDDKCSRTKLIFKKKDHMRIFIKFLITFGVFVHHISYILYLKIYLNNCEIEILYQYIVTNNHNKKHDYILMIENSFDF